jgi:DHA1 family tetracycline resistance protein-like MFS transporter
MASVTKKTLGSIFLVVFLDLLGYGIIVPVVAPLLLGGDLVSGGLAHKEVILGALIAIYPLMQFFAAPFLGTLADRHGRRNLLMLCLCGTALGYVLFAIGILTGQLWLLFVGRALDGFTGGNIAIARAVIADVSTERTASRNFGLIGIAVGIGLIVGPFIGSIFSDSSIVSWFSYLVPFWLAAILTLLSVVALWFFLPETLPEKIHKPITLLTAPKNVAKAFKLKKLRTLFITSLFQLFGFAMYTQFFQVFLIQRFSPTSVGLGLTIAFIGALVVLAQGFLNPIAVRRFNSKILVAWSLALLAVSILGVSVSYEWPMMLFFLGLSALASGFVYPNLTALVSASADRSSQGEVMGLYQSVESLAQSAGPFTAGFIASRGEGLPIWLSAVAIGIAWLFFYLVYSKTITAEPAFHEE